MRKKEDSSWNTRRNLVKFFWNFNCNLAFSFPVSTKDSLWPVLATICFFQIYCLERRDASGQESGILDINNEIPTPPHCVWRRKRYWFLNECHKFCVRCCMYLHRYFKFDSTSNSLAFCVSISVWLLSGCCISSWYGVFFPTAFPLSDVLVKDGCTKRGSEEHDTTSHPWPAP